MFTVPQSNHPNVLVLMCDQMQHSRMNFIDPIAHTPFLNDLAAESVYFKNAYTCHGQCVPARAAFQTGLYPHECGIMVIYGFHGHGARLTPKYQTLGHCFKEAGYQTAYFGKTHFGVPLDQLGYDTGVEHSPIDDPNVRSGRRLKAGSLASSERLLERTRIAVDLANSTCRSRLVAS